MPMDQQDVIETFFYMLGQFAFDRAKSYAEAKKDWLQKASPTSTPFLCMLSTFAQLAEAEKFYHNHPFITQPHSSFLPSRHFLRKERSLKDVYEDVRLELQRIEVRPKQNRLRAELDRKFSDSTGSAAASIVGHKRYHRADDSQSQLDRTSSSGLSIGRQQTAGTSSFNVSDANNRSGSASPRPPSVRSGDNIAGDQPQATGSNASHHLHDLQSPNKGFSPFSWFSSGNSRQKNQASHQAKNKQQQQQQQQAATPVSRRLFTDSVSNEAIQARSSVVEYDSTQYTIGRLEETPGPTSRQILSPSISSPLQQLQASNSVSSLALPSSILPTLASTSTGASTTAIVDFSEELMSHFCLQLQYYTQARLELIGIYEKLYEIAGKKHIHVDGISIQLSIFCRKYHNYFHHPLLAPIKEGMTLECEVLMTLIRATIDIKHWRFLTSVIDLQEAQQKLNYWAANTFNKETSKRRFQVKAQPIPRLYDWLCKLREFLVAKFTIYFHSTLYKNLPANTIKNTCTKLSIDFYQKLSHFQRKVDALFIAMLFDVTTEKDYRGQGYHLPTTSFDQPKGKNTLQAMVVIPVDAKPKLESLQAELFMIVAGQSQALNEGQFQLFDPSKQLTFFLAKPDSHVVLIITVEGQRLDREAIIKTFMNEITNQLSGNRVIMSLNSTSAKSPQR